MATKFLDYDGLKLVIKKFNERNDGKYIISALKGAANGVASLDANGKIPVQQLGNLDVTVFKVVTELPKSDIKPYIYIIKNVEKPTDNEYIEWVYVTEEKRWEKLGEYKADINLTHYAKLKGDNEFTGNNIFSGSDNSFTQNLYSTGMHVYKTGESEHDTIPEGAYAWTTDGNYLDLTSYNDLVATTWPFKLTSFKPSSYVLEIGSPASETFSWNYDNNKHTVKTQTLTLTSKTPSSNDSGTVIGTKSYNIVAGTKSQVSTSSDLTALCDQRAIITARLACTNSSDLSTSSSIVIQAIHPKYWGVLSTNTVPTTATGLTKILEYGSKTILNNVILVNQYLVFMYPDEFGFSEIKNITDGSAPYIGAFNTGTTTIAGTTYRYYIMDKPGNITWSQLQFLLA